MDFNKELLQTIKKSFLFVIQSDNNNRSTKKVDIIHTQIAQHLKILFNDKFLIKTKNKNNQDEKIKGRYNDKKVDIVIQNKNKKILGGIGLKFILSSFQKNSNNYFENMLGETANIRSNNISYFQIIIFLHNTPNFSKKNQIKNFTLITKKLLMKYEILSNDNITSYFHSPSKTLILILKDNFKDIYKKITSKQEYYDFYKNNEFNFDFYNGIKTKDFGTSVILNDYETFLKKIVDSMNV